MDLVVVKRCAWGYGLDNVLHILFYCIEFCDLLNPRIILLFSKMNTLMDILELAMNGGWGTIIICGVVFAFTFSMFRYDM